MKKRISLYIAIAVVLLMMIFCVVLFMTPAATDVCSDELIVCLDTAHDMAFWEKLGGGIKCFFANICCVFKNTGMLF